MPVQLAPGEKINFVYSVIILAEKEKMSDRKEEDSQGQSGDISEEEEVMLLAVDVLPPAVIAQLAEMMENGHIKIPIYYRSPIGT